MDDSLELNVADFVSRDDAALKSLSFNIPFRDLYDALERGERQQRLEEKTPPPEEQPSRKRVRFEFNWELSLPGPPAGPMRELRSSSSKRRRLEASHLDDTEGLGRAMALRHRRSI